jgi:hypothetical protein
LPGFDVRIGACFCLQCATARRPFPTIILKIMKAVSFGSPLFYAILAGADQLLGISSQ